MKKVSLELLKNCANNLMFDMEEEEYQTLLNEFDLLLDQMSLIGQIEGLDEEEAMTFPFDCHTDYLREDEEKTPLSVQEVLLNAKDVAAGQIKLPKVVG